MKDSWEILRVGLNPLEGGIASYRWSQMGWCGSREGCPEEAGRCRTGSGEL